jgi:hypothetical protein
MKFNMLGIGKIDFQYKLNNFENNYHIFNFHD